MSYDDRPDVPYRNESQEAEITRLRNELREAEQEIAVLGPSGKCLLCSDRERERDEALAQVAVLIRAIEQSPLDSSDISRLIGVGKLSKTAVAQARALLDWLKELEKEPTITLPPNGRSLSLGELVDEYLELLDRLQLAEAVVEAFEYCEGGRGAFSCCEPHDARCPKSRASRPEDWKGAWICKCGREKLDAALAAWEEGKG